MSGAPLIPVNPAQKNDEHCRHKMEAVTLKVEGSGNGIKTVFPNIDEICRKLNRHPVLLTKFFGFELGALSKFQKEDNKHLVMGNFRPDIIQEKVYEFVRRFVMCPKCQDPGTHFYTKLKKRVAQLHMNCTSCGNELDMDVDPKNSRINKLILEMIESNTGGEMIRVPPAAGAAADGSGAAAAAAASAADANPASPTTAEAQQAAADKAQAAASEERTAAQAAAAHRSEKWYRPAQETETKNPITELCRALQAAIDDGAGVATAKAHQLKTVMNFEDDEVVRLCFQAAVSSGDESRPLEAIHKRAGFLRNFVAVARGATVLSNRIRFLLELVRIFKPSAKAAPGVDKSDRVPIGVLMFLDDGIIGFDDVEEWAQSSLAVEVVKEAKKGKTTYYRNIAEKCKNLFDWMRIDMKLEAAASALAKESTK